MRYWAYVALAIIVGVMGVMQENEAQALSAWVVVIIALILSDLYNAVKKSK